MQCTSVNQIATTWKLTSLICCPLSGQRVPILCPIVAVDKVCRNATPSELKKVVIWLTGDNIIQTKHPVVDASIKLVNFRG
jgi:hypothetical protein